MIVEFKLAADTHQAVSHVSLDEAYIEGIRQMGETHSTEIVMTSGHVWTVDALYGDVVKLVWEGRFHVDRPKT